MKTNRIYSIVTALAVLALAAPVLAADKAGKKPTLMIGSVIAIDAVKQLSKDSGHTRDLDQLIQSLDSFFQNEVTATRKFQVVGAKAALKQLNEVQEFHNSGNVDGATAARLGEITGAQLLAIPSIIEFLYGKETRNFSATGKSVDITVLRVRCILNVYDTTKGTLKGSAKFLKEEQDNNLRGGLGSVLAKKVIGNIAESLAGQMSNRLVDVEFPPRVVMALGTTVGFNRGDQAGVKIGDIWEVYATDVVELEGEKLIIEIPVGVIKIDRITPKVSYGKVLGENLGIAKNCTIRKKQEIPKANGPGGGGSTPTDPEKPKSLRDRLKEKLKK